MFNDHGMLFLETYMDLEARGLVNSETGDETTPRDNAQSKKRKKGILWRPTYKRELMNFTITHKEC